MRRFMILVAIGYLALFAQLQAQSNTMGYMKYCNSRYAFCLQRPVFLHMDEAPANNDGRRFYDNSGFSLRAYGSYNALSNSLREQMLEDRKDFDRVTYQVIRDGWYALSGYQGQNILYKKTYMRGDIFYHIYIIYPSKLKNNYDNMVSHISKSFYIVD